MPVAAFAVRDWLQPIMRAAAAVDYPWTKLYEELKLVEPVYRKTEFGYDYRSYLSAYEKGERLKYVSHEYKPSADLFSEARVGMRKTFKYNTETTFYDAEGNVYSTRSSFVASDRQLTRGEIEKIVEDRLGDIAWDSAGGEVKATLSEAWHREGDMWD